MERPASPNEPPTTPHTGAATRPTVSALSHRGPSVGIPRSTRQKPLLLLRPARRGLLCCHELTTSPHVRHHIHASTGSALLAVRVHTRGRPATVAAVARDTGIRERLGSLTETVSGVSIKEKKQAHPAGTVDREKQLCVGDSACGPRKVMPSGFSTGFYEEHVMLNPPLFGPRLSVHKEKTVEGVGIAFCKWVNLPKSDRRYDRTSSPSTPTRWQVTDGRAVRDKVVVNIRFISAAKTALHSLRDSSTTAINTSFSQHAQLR